MKEARGRAQMIVRRPQRSAGCQSESEQCYIKHPGEVRSDYRGEKCRLPDEEKGRT